MGSDPSNEIFPIYLLLLGLSLASVPPMGESQICQHDLRGREWGSAEPHFLFLVGFLVCPEPLGWMVLVLAVVVCPPAAQGHHLGVAKWARSGLRIKLMLGLCLPKGCLVRPPRS